jgi:hypothetical protein
MKTLNIATFFGIFLSAIVLANSPELAQCGVGPMHSGTPDEVLNLKIKDCSKIAGSLKKTSQGIVWYRVARKQDPSTLWFYEVWMDSSTGLIWSTPLDHEMSHYQAAKSEDGQKSVAGVSERVFGLPMAKEFRKAKNDGILEVMRSMSWVRFWSSTLDSRSSNYALYFHGEDGGIYSGYRGDLSDCYVVLVGR